MFVQRSNGGACARCPRPACSRRCASPAASRPPTAPTTPRPPPPPPRPTRARRSSVARPPPPAARPSPATSRPSAAPVSPPAPAAQGARRTLSESVLQDHVHAVRFPIVKVEIGFRSGFRTRKTRSLSLVADSFLLYWPVYLIAHFSSSERLLASEYYHYYRVLKVAYTRTLSMK